METEIIVLEGRLKSQETETERQADEVSFT